MSQGFTSALNLPLPVASGGTGVTTSNWTAASLTFNPTTQGIVGTTTNNDAGAGYVGQIISSEVQSGSAVALTSGVTANVTSITITAGDWDVFGQIGYAPSSLATRIGYSAAGFSTTSATLPASLYWVSDSRNLLTNIPLNLVYAVPTLRYSVSGSTTIYLTAQVAFDTAGLSAFGAIYARRRR